MKLPTILQVFSYLCIAMTVSTLSTSLSLPVCKDKCGNVTIPYPFGIGSECSANLSFTINCQNSTTPFLNSIKLEAINISVLGMLVVKQPVSPMKCSSVLSTGSLPISLKGSPFTISANYNSLAVLGCKNSVWLRANKTSTTGGCTAICDANSTEGYCNGVNCCQTTIPPQLKELEYTYRTSEASNNNSLCGYVFPVDKKWLEKDLKSYRGLLRDMSNPFDREFGSVPLVLEWKFGKLPDDVNDSTLKIQRICGGSVIGTLIIVLIACRSTKAIRKRIKANRKRKCFKRNGGFLLKQQLSATDNGLEKTKLYSSNELTQATDGFNENRILGRGGQGTVYKGMLADGRVIAVKKSKKVEESDIEVFINEVVILSQVNHRNVVKLSGCCLETEVPLLVYEFIPNGTLFQHIHEPREEFPLTWELRVRIAREVAAALAYLHSAASAPIYHRDIKSTNILLDDKYRAKVSDFGTSRSVAIDQTHLTTRVLGTFGYFDPEYFQSSQFTDKSDVYSFGVVMVELLTGEKAISSMRVELEMSLATHFLHSMEENQLFDILDARVLEEGKREEVVVMAELARRCLHFNGKRRPTMKEVAVALDGIQMMNAGSSFVQNQDDNKHFHSIEVVESCDFSSISGSMHLDTIVW